MDPSLSNPSRWSRAQWAAKCQKQGWGQPDRVRVMTSPQVKSPGRINPLDIQQALGYLGKAQGSELYAKG